MKVVIIDDEENARITLSALLGEYIPEVNIVAQCANVPEGVLAINRHNPDVVFLDIEMPEYNGFELFDFFKEITFDVIFVTAYSQYAIRAFEVSAIDYLLKPVEIDNLKAAVAKAGKRRNPESMIQRLSMLKDTYTGNEIRKIALPMNNGLLFVNLNQIILFEADRAYTNVLLNDGSKVTVTKPLRTFEDALATHSFIFRPHRSFLINIHYIKKYLKGESTIIMENLTNIPVARERKQDFEDLLKNLRLIV